MNAASHLRVQILAGLVLLGAAASAWLAPRALHRPLLDRVTAVESALQTRLSAPARPRDVEFADPAEFDRLLSLAPDPRRVDVLPFYEEGERAAFARVRWQTAIPEETDAQLAAPMAVQALYSAGGVALSWEHAAATRALAGRLPAQHRLAVRIYRSEGESPAELLATVPLETSRYRDALMPLVGGELHYELWSVLLAGDRDALLSAETSDLVTVAVPDHFRLVLLDGTLERAKFRVELGPPGVPLVAESLELRPGEPLSVAGRPTGLILESLEMKREERMFERQRMVFGPGGSLVLDARSGEPRQTTSQVLVPVERLIATLRGRDGTASRTLETDLP
ncbi:MAG: hypothetical protein DHS20C15_21890 [Planctomycetota bacterium]|nr:MAG: hypothetical protein DHS20C15_21890 [Planctomycetota bacterium]